MEVMVSERTLVRLPAAWRVPLAWLAALTLATAVFTADLASGTEVSFSFFYLVPIALSTWTLGRRAGVLFAFACAGAWATAYFLAGQFYSNPRIIYWNTAVELAMFLTVALTLDSLRRGIAKRAALTERLESAYRGLDREFAVVGDIQRSLLPAEVPQPRGLALAVHYATSTRAGGDYYDFFALPDGRLGIFIADVSGHGPPAAVVMAILRVLLHGERDALPFPERVLSTLNARLASHTLRGQFATACYAILTPATGEVEYALAGHNPPLRFSIAERVVTEFENPAGPPLGLFAEPSFERRLLRLGAGDTLVFYTDGLTEAANAVGEFFGVERVRELMLAYYDAAPDVLRDRIVEAVERHTGGGPQADDVTLVIVRAARVTSALAPATHAAPATAAVASAASR
jgi:serine phosphatase RsbU (regulator of sigma subunit)